MSLFTPVNQVRLTNVAYVRLQKGGKRFEIACYRNKALSWRNKVETDINEVLQIDSIFSNVSKGQLASAKDIEHAFGTTDKKLVCIEILNKGELQVSDQERIALQESMLKDIANIIVEKTINPENDRPYTVAIIQAALKQIQFSVNTTKSSKSQALEAIRKLKEVMPIKRTKMLLRIHYNPRDDPTIRSRLAKEGATILGTSTTASGSGSGTAGTGASVDFEIEPDMYRAVEAMVKSLSADAVRMEVLQMRSANTGTAAAGASAVADATLATAASQGLSLAEQAERFNDPVAVPPSSPTVSSTGSGPRDLSTAALEAAALAAARERLNMPIGRKGHHTKGALELDDSDQEGVDTLGHIKKAPSLNKRKEKTREKKLKKKSMKAKAAAGAVAAGKDGAGEDDSGSDDDDSCAAGVEEKTDDPVAMEAADGPAGGGKADSGKAESSAGAGHSAGGDKQGKRGKRLEREALAERQRKAAELQARLDGEAQQLRAQQEALHRQRSGPTGAVPESGEAAAAAPTAVGTGTSDAGAGVTASGTVQRCTTCGGAFTDAIKYRQHFRSEWHRHNLNRKLKELPPMSEEEFRVSEGLSVAP